MCPRPHRQNPAMTSQPPFRHPGFSQQKLLRSSHLYLRLKQPCLPSQSPRPHNCCPPYDLDTAIQKKVGHNIKHARQAFCLQSCMRAAASLFCTASGRQSFCAGTDWLALNSHGQFSEQGSSLHHLQQRLGRIPELPKGACVHRRSDNLWLPLKEVRPVESYWSAVHTSGSRY